MGVKWSKLQLQNLQRLAKTMTVTAAGGKGELKALQKNYGKVKERFTLKRKPEITIIAMYPCIYHIKKLRHEWVYKLTLYTSTVILYMCGLQRIGKAWKTFTTVN